MKIRPLIVGNAERQKIEQVLLFARNNRVSLEQMKEAHRLWNKGIRTDAIGDDPRFRCEIPVGFRIVYSEEFHPPGLMRHLSVSLSNPFSVPDIPMVETIMELFNFRNPLRSPHVMVFSEKCDYSVTAINVMEHIEEIEIRLQHPGTESIN